MQQSDAQRAAAQILSFRAELTELERDGVLVLPPDERAHLDAYHDARLKTLSRDFDIDASAVEGRLSIGMKIASALGGLALCLALGNFVQRYWGELSTAVQVLLLVSAPLLSLFACEFAARREKTLYFTSLFCLVALGAFVVDLYVLGEIFSLTPTPSAFTVWAAFALLLAYRYRLRLMLLLGLLLCVAVVPMWFYYLGGFEWTWTYRRVELVIIPGVICGVLSFRQLKDFAAVFRAVAVATILSALLVLSEWGYGTFLPISKVSAESIATLLGFAVSAWMTTVAIRRDWTETTILSSLCFGGFLLFKMYDWLWDTMPAFLFFAIIGVLSLGLLWLFRRMRIQLKETA